MLAAGVDPAQATDSDILQARVQQWVAFDGCVDRHAPPPPWWALLVWPLALFASATLLFFCLPAWKGRRRRVVPLRNVDHDGEVRRTLEQLAAVAGLLRLPRVVVDPGALSTGALVFGRDGRPTMCLHGGLLARRSTDPDGFRAVVLHEFAHVRNRDLTLTYATVTLWRVFLALTLPLYLLWSVAMVVGGAAQELGSSQLVLAARGLVLVLVLGMLVHLSRADVLRSREIYADRTAAHWGADLHRSRVAEPPAESGRVRRALVSFAQLFRTHPRWDVRRAALADPWLLFRISAFPIFLTGAAATLLNYHLITAFQQYVRSPTVWMAQLSTLAAAALVVAVSGVPLWRAAVHSLLTGHRMPSAVRAGLWLGAGMTLGALVAGQGALNQWLPARPLVLLLLLPAGAVFAWWTAQCARLWVAKWRGRSLRPVVFLVLLASCLTLASWLTWWQGSGATLTLGWWFDPQDLRTWVDRAYPGPAGQHEGLRAAVALAAPVLLSLAEPPLGTSAIVALYLASLLACLSRPSHGTPRWLGGEAGVGVDGAVPAGAGYGAKSGGGDPGPGGAGADTMPGDVSPVPGSAGTSPAGANPGPSDTPASVGPSRTGATRPTPEPAGTGSGTGPGRTDASTEPVGIRPGLPGPELAGAGDPTNSDGAEPSSGDSDSCTKPGDTGPRPAHTGADAELTDTNTGPADPKAVSTGADAKPVGTGPEPSHTDASPKRLDPSPVLPHPEFAGSEAVTEPGDTSPRSGDVGPSTEPAGSGSPPISPELSDTGTDAEPSHTGANTQPISPSPEILGASTGAGTEPSATDPGADAGVRPKPTDAGPQPANTRVGAESGDTGAGAKPGSATPQPADTQAGPAGPRPTNTGTDAMSADAGAEPADPNPAPAGADAKCPEPAGPSPELPDPEPSSTGAGTKPSATGPGSGDESPDLEPADAGSQPTGRHAVPRRRPVVIPALLGGAAASLAVLGVQAYLASVSGQAAPVARGSSQGLLVLAWVWGWLLGVAVLAAVVAGVLSRGYRLLAAFVAAETTVLLGLATLYVTLSLDGCAPVPNSFAESCGWRPGEVVRWGDLHIVVQSTLLLGGFAAVLISALLSAASRLRTSLRIRSRRRPAIPTPAAPRHTAARRTGTVLLVLVALLVAGGETVHQERKAARLPDAAALQAMSYQVSPDRAPESRVTARVRKKQMDAWLELGGQELMDRLSRERARFNEVLNASGRGPERLERLRGLRPVCAGLRHLARDTDAYFRTPDPRAQLSWQRLAPQLRKTATTCATGLRELGPGTDQWGEVSLHTAALQLESAHNTRQLMEVHLSMVRYNAKFFPRAVCGPHRGAVCS
nr:M48 family metalloprotease [Streptomyces sp. HNM0574]